MKSFNQDWQKLVALARQAPPAGDDLIVPPGLATRVAALAAARPASPWGGLERFALRGLVAAISCCTAVMIYSYFGQGSELIDEAEFNDSVSEYVSLS